MTYSFERREGTEFVPVDHQSLMVGDTVRILTREGGPPPWGQVDSITQQGDIHVVKVEAQGMSISLDVQGWKGR